MKSLLFAAFAVSQATPIPIVEDLNHNIEDRNIFGDVINLSDVKIPHLDVNLYSISDNPEKDEIHDYILFELMSNNSEDEIISDLLYEIYSSPESFDIKGMPHEKPALNEKHTYKVDVLAKKDIWNRYKGILTFEITALNKDTDYKSLGDIIKNTNIGKITDPTEIKIIDALKKINEFPSDLKLEVNEINYNSAIIYDAHENYAGKLRIDYDGFVEEWYKDKYDSGVEKVHIYSGDQEDGGTTDISFKPNLGKEKFTDKFSTIKFETSVYAWSGSGGFIYGSGDGEKDSELENIDFELSTSAPNDIENIVSYSYDNFNEEYIEISVSTKWSEKDDSLQFSFRSWVKGHGYWGNTYYAKAESRLKVSNITFI